MEHLRFKPLSSTYYSSVWSNVVSWEIPKINEWFKLGNSSMGNCFHCHAWFLRVYPMNLASNIYLSHSNPIPSPFISHLWSIHIPFIISIDWFKGKIQENPISWKHICMYIYILYMFVWFPVEFPLSQPIESRNCRFFVSSVTRCKFSLACCVKWPRGGTFRDRMLSVLMGIMVTLW